MSQGRTRLPLATDDWDRSWGDQLIRAIDQNLDSAFANVAATPTGAGTVTSVAVSGGTTGITTSGSPITTSGTITLGGTLKISNGGTGATTAGTALTALGAAPLASPTFTGTVTIPAGASITGYATSGANSSITSLSGLTTPLSVTQGGTGATNATDARTNLGITGGGSVISVDVSGGTTGLTTSGGPITNSGTITIGGTLAIASGGTGATTAGTALTALGAAPLASPALTGTPTSTTAAVDTSTTQIATTAFVTGQAASVAPLINGTAATGTSLRYARQDHVHPTDTTRAPLASPTFTGTVTIPAGASIAGYATSGANSNITSLTGLTTPLSISQGGTGATNATDARTNLGITGGGSVTSVAVSGGTTGLTTSGGPITTSGTITLAGTLAASNGGTGASTLTANNVLLGNGTSAVQFVAPGTTGNVLTSNGTTWTSAAGGTPTTGTAGYALTGNGASPATFQGFLQPGTGATTRTWQNKAADFVSVKDFGAVGDGTTNDTAAIQAALNTKKNVYLPAGRYLVTSGLSMTSSSQRMYGESGFGPFGLNEVSATTVACTIIEWGAPNDGTARDVITINRLQHCIIESLTIRRSPAQFTNHLMVGHGVNFTNSYFCEVRSCRITGTGNGVSMWGTGNQVVDCELRAFYGSYGVRYFGTNDEPSLRGVLDRVVSDNVDAFDYGVPTTFNHVEYDSYAHSLIIIACALLQGNNAIYMHDSVGIADPYSWPTWIHAFDVECDHQYGAGVVLSGGEGCFITTSWIGSTWTGNGVITSGAWRGELLITNSRILGNAQYGILLNAGVDACINNNIISANSQKTANLANIGVGSNISKFSITGNKIGGDIVGNVGPQAYGIYIVGGSTDYYQILGNIIVGSTTPILDNATSATNKIVQDYTVNGGGLKMTGNLISASIAPLADNIYQLGASGGRWTAVWAVNGTIQTSDPSLKTDISPLPTALPIIQDIDPVTFKWISGGLVPEKRITRKQLPILGTEDFTEEDVEETVYVDRPGKRTHWGFLASDVKAAFDKTGLDFGGYVKDEEGTEHLRPDQLIPVLWKAVQELKSEFDSYRKEHPEASPVATTEVKI